MAEKEIHQFEVIGHSNGSGGVPFVRCSNYKSGCQWTGKEMYAKDHVEQSCDYRSIKCRYCENVIIKYAYQDHLLFYCQKKMFRIINHCKEGEPLYQCGNYESGCKWIGRRKHKEDHAYRCNFRSIICTSCEEVIIKGYYYDHLMLFCRHRMDGSCYEDWQLPSLYLCPFSHLGCKWRGTPSSYEKIHQFQCNKQLKQCAVCYKMCRKGELPYHVQNDCPLKFDHVEGTFGNGVYSFNHEPQSNIEKKD